jgi:hypothetical protein
MEQHPSVDIVEASVYDGVESGATDAEYRECGELEL